MNLMTTGDRRSGDGMPTQESMAHEYLLDNLERQAISQSGVGVGVGVDVDTKRTRKTAYLDGLRGLAAFLVYMQHQAPFFYPGEMDITLGYGYPLENGEEHRVFASLPFVRLFYSGGNAAVAIFFVLSGYVLAKGPLKLLQRRADTNQALKCYNVLDSAIVRRPFRLYIPPIGVSYLVALALHLPFGLIETSVPAAQSNVFAEIWKCTIELITFLNPFQEHGFFIKWFTYDLVIWTIPIELKGSMLIFILVATLNYTNLGRWQKSQVPLLILLACFLLQIYQWTMSLFVFGLVLCIFDDRKEQQQLLHQDEQQQQQQQQQNQEKIAYRSSSLSSSHVSPQTSRIFYHVCFIVGWYFLCQPAGVKEAKRSELTPGWATLTHLIPKQYYIDEYWRYFHSIGAVLLVYSVLRIRWLQKLLSTKTLLYMGRISFAFYLVHAPLLWTWGDRIQRMLGQPRKNLKGELWTDNKLAWLVPDLGPTGLSTRFFVALMGILPMIFLVSEFGTRWLDEPSIRIGRMVSVRLGYDKSVDGGPGSVEQDQQLELNARRD